MITLKAVGQAAADTLFWILGARSGRWPKLRNSFVSGKSCAACGSVKNLTAHHITPVHVNPDLELDPSNLVVLCSKPSNCHFIFGHLHSFKSWNPDVIKDCEVHFNKVRKRPCLSKE